SATARPNPNAIPYAPDAYASEERGYVPPGSPARSRGPQARPMARRPADEVEEETGTSPAVWAAGAIALLILALVGFLVFRLLSGPTTPHGAPGTGPRLVSETRNRAER